MYFSDEFEYDVNGVTYFVEVEGTITEDSTILDKVVIQDNNGVIDDTDDCYNEIYDYAQNRDYEVEIHHSDFDYYSADFNNFLREKDEL